MLSLDLLLLWALLLTTNLLSLTSCQCTKSFMNMDENVLGEKYEESVKLFEQLARMFLEEETPLLLLNYDLCISQIMELFSLEEDPVFLECLENILTQIKWQQDRIKNACTSGTIELTNKANPSHEQTKTPEKKGNCSKDTRWGQRKEMIKLTEQKVSGNGLSDIIGLEGVKALLKKSVLLPMTYPLLFTGGRKPWNQILLYGPPGTGKSKLAQALACESSSQLYSVSSADLLSSWVGESEKMIKDLFEFTRINNHKSILFIDEIDSICRKRTAKEGDHSRSIKNQLLIELDQNLTYEKCFILCATNCPWDIDSAFLRRFQCRIYVPLPDSSTRIELIQKNCSEINLDMNSEEWNIIAERTEGYSGADLVHLTNFALQEPLGELENNQTWIVKNDKWIPCATNTPNCVKIPISLVPPEKVDVRDVMLKDFLKAVEFMPKTVNQLELEKYTEYSRIN